MDHQHLQMLNESGDDEEELVINNKNLSEKSTDEDIEEGLEEKIFEQNK